MALGMRESAATAYESANGDFLAVLKNSFELSRRSMKAWGRSLIFLGASICGT